MDEGWREVGERVFVRRHVSADLNVGLVVGDSSCVVVDSRLTPVQGRDLVAAVRTLTPNGSWMTANRMDAPQ